MKETKRGDRSQVLAVGYKSKTPNYQFRTEKKLS